MDQSMIAGLYRCRLRNIFLTNFSCFPNKNDNDLYSTGLLITIKPVTIDWVSQANPIVLLFWQKDENHQRRQSPTRS
jgi:hypothetical protein